MASNSGDISVSTIVLYVVIGFFILGGFVGGCMWAEPQYGVYKQRLAGEAELAHSEYSKKVLVQTATARNDAAAMDAKAEVTKAEGLAKAIQIVGEMAHKYPEYRHQVFIEGFARALEDGKINQVIYVPTEANIPILEAGKREHRVEK